jgi:hypothetical protein
MFERAKPYQGAVDEAARTFGVDPEVLMGVAAAESSFRPRDSADGGHGLFQITAPPADALAQAKRALGVTTLDLADPRHNAFVAAATLRLYHDQMHGDPLLALLAYNIGPANGGLATIMRQFGARDFVMAQPYLKDLPRDYPVRVLAAALAYRVYRTEGRLLRYEDGDNARRIQALGIPASPPRSRWWWRDDRGARRTRCRASSASRTWATSPTSATCTRSCRTRTAPRASSQCCTS